MSPEAQDRRILRVPLIREPLANAHPIRESLRRVILSIGVRRREQRRVVERDSQRATSISLVSLLVDAPLVVEG